MAAIGDGEETLLDQIAMQAALPLSTVLSSLMRLEMNRMVRQLPGQRYLRTRSADNSC